MKNPERGAADEGVLFSTLTFAMKFLTVTAMLLLLAQPSWGDDSVIRAMMKGNHGYSEEQIRTEIAKGCDGAGDMRICAWYGYHQKDIALNKTYQDLKRRLASARNRQALIESQRAWLAFRDARCLFSSADWEGGSFREVAIAICWETMTDAREKELAEILKCDVENGPCIELRDLHSTRSPRCKPVLALRGRFSAFDS